MENNIKKTASIVIISITAFCIIALSALGIIAKNMPFDDNDDLAVSAITSQLNKKINSVEEKYAVDGYVPEDKIQDTMNGIIKIAKDAKESNLIEDYSTGTTCVSMDQTDGITLVYMMPLEDKKAKADDKNAGRIVTLQPNYDKFEKKKEDEIDNCAKKLSKNKYYNFKESDNLDNGAVSLENIKKLSKSSVIIWDSHGGYTKYYHSFLATTIPFDSLPKKYKDDKKSHRILRSNNGYTLITYKFFNTYLKEDSLEGSVIYLGACDTGTDDVLANTLISKGASTVYGHSTTVSVSYDLKMVATVFDNLCKGKTTEKSLSLAKKKNGKYDDSSKKRNDELLLFGEKSKKFKMENEQPSSTSTHTTAQAVDVDPLSVIHSGLWYCDTGDGTSTDDKQGYYFAKSGLAWIVNFKTLEMTQYSAKYKTSDDGTITVEPFGEGDNQKMILKYKNDSLFSLKYRDLNIETGEYYDVDGTYKLKQYIPKITKDNVKDKSSDIIRTYVDCLNNFMGMPLSQTDSPTVDYEKSKEVNGKTYYRYSLKEEYITDRLSYALDNKYRKKYYKKDYIIPDNNYCYIYLDGFESDFMTALRITDQKKELYDGELISAKNGTYIVRAKVIYGYEGSAQEDFTFTIKTINKRLVICDVKKSNYELLEGDNFSG